MSQRVIMNTSQSYAIIGPVGPPGRDADPMDALPRLLAALGLRAGDRLVVRDVNGEERELPLPCLDEAAVREVLES
jgi:hypothetical protein